VDALSLNTRRGKSRGIVIKPGQRSEGRKKNTVLLEKEDSRDPSRSFREHLWATACVKGAPASASGTRRSTKRSTRSARGKDMTGSGADCLEGFLGFSYLMQSVSMARKRRGRGATKKETESCGKRSLRDLKRGGEVTDCIHGVVRLSWGYLEAWWRSGPCHLKKIENDRKKDTQV